jgi:hypothetical protein
VVSARPMQTSPSSCGTILLNKQKSPATFYDARDSTQPSPHTTNYMAINTTGMHIRSHHPAQERSSTSHPPSALPGDHEASTHGTAALHSTTIGATTSMSRTQEQCASLAHTNSTHNIVTCQRSRKASTFTKSYANYYAGYYSCQDTNAAFSSLQ